MRSRFARTPVPAIRTLAERHDAVVRGGGLGLQFRQAWPGQRSAERRSKSPPTTSPRFSGPRSAILITMRGMPAGSCPGRPRRPESRPGDDVDGGAGRAITPIRFRFMPRS
jgi:hypothetical protein